MWGCFLHFQTRLSLSCSLPHACGGVSVSGWGEAAYLVSSPRMWGCFWQDCKATWPIHRLPHACGGVSMAGELRSPPPSSSPRMWGCFCVFFTVKNLQEVFPTHVGVFLGMLSVCCAGTGLPHACGGVSQRSGGHPASPWSSPRMWGCFSRSGAWDDFGTVFPTHVGVFLPEAAGVASRRGLPHACGGVSGKPACSTSSRRSSPRMWGCF